MSLRIGRHFLQLQAAIEVLRMLEIPEVFHSFAPTDYVELYTAATVRFNKKNGIINVVSFFSIKMFMFVIVFFNVF